MEAGQTQHGMQLDSGQIITAAVLVGVGGLVAFVGMILGGSAAFAQGLRWVRSLETPPREVARSKWKQLKAASSAGADAWRSSPAQITAIK
jgi:hypothetical protein